MAPAFSSLRQAVSFVGLVGGLLLLPPILGWLHLYSRADAYATMPREEGSYAFMRQQIFEEKSDVDIAFVGASRVFRGLDPRVVQQGLSIRLGRPARVFALAGNWSGEDRDYFVLRDLLRHRRVKVLVLCMHENDDDFWEQPFMWSFRFFQLGNDSEALAGLSFRSRAAYYGAAVLGGPRQLLAAAVPPLIATPPPCADSLGVVELTSRSAQETPVVPFSPRPLRLPPEAMIYSPQTRQNFHFAGKHMGPLQEHFMARIGTLLKRYGVHLVILYIPPDLALAQERAEAAGTNLRPGTTNLPPLPDTVEEFSDWPEVFGVPADLVGVPGATLFAGMTNDEIERLYDDRLHFNRDGRRYFTQVIAPALVELYARKPQAH